MATDQTIHSKKREQQRTNQFSDCKGKEKRTSIESLFFAKLLTYFISFNPHGDHPPLLPSFPFPSPSFPFLFFLYNF